MEQNNKKFNNAMHKFVGVLDKYGWGERKGRLKCPLSFHGKVSRNGLLSAQGRKLLKKDP